MRSSSFSDPRLLVVASSVAVLALTPGVARAQLCPAPTPITCGDVINSATSGASLIDVYEPCLGWPLVGPEAVYQLDAEAGQLVTFTAIAITPWDLAITVLAADGSDCAPLACLQAADDGESNPEVVTAVFPAAGRYYVVIDGYAGVLAAEGPFSLAVDCTCADRDGDGESAVDAAQCVSGTDCCDTGHELAVLGCSPETAATIHAGAYDLCGDGIDQNCDGADAACAQRCVDAPAITCGGMVAGTTSQAPDRIGDYACLARPQTGGEVSYRLELTEPRRVVAAVTAQGHDASVAVIPERQAVCEASLCVAGADAGTSGTEQVEAFLAPGVYYVVVDGFNYSGGAFELDVACDVCDDRDGDAAIGLSGTCGAGSDCCDRGDEVSLGCTTARAAAIHPGAVDFCGDGVDYDCDGRDCIDDADRDGAGAASQGGADCCDRGDEAFPGCSPEQAAAIRPGAREICGNGVDEDCNGSDLACPTCAAGTQLACGDKGTADTTGASALVSDYCGAGVGYWTGGERVFALTPATDTTVRFTTTYDPQAATLDVIALDDAGVSGVCDPAACLAGSFSERGVELVTFFAKAGHTYYLAVDDRMGGGAPFTYEVGCATETLPPATSITCDDLAIDTSATGNGQVDAYDGIGYPLLAPERVFRFVPGADVRVDLQLGFGGGSAMDLGLLVLGDECTGANPLGTLVAFSDAHQADGAPGGEALSFDARGCATYLLVVDGYRRTDAGAFTLGLACPVRCAPGEALCGSRDCADLATSPVHCSACGAACAYAHGAGVCTAGVCGLGECDPGYDDCDGDAANGCEAETVGDPENCGACGHVCTALPHAAVAGCSAGACTPVACDDGFDDCNGQGADGCEAALATDAVNCGACGSSCASGEVCASGACCADHDGDGHAGAACGGDDCNDGDRTVFPGASDLCGDHVDQDCDGADRSCTDLEAHGVAGCAATGPWPGGALLALLVTVVRRRRARRG